MRSAIFDLDGTLADTSVDLIAAANACFATDPLDPERDKATAFRGGRAMLALGAARSGEDWSAERTEAGYREFLERYGAALDRHTTLYEGVEDSLGQLEAAGWRLGVCTNKPEAMAEAVLSSLGVRGRFRALLGADTLPVKKPDPRHLLETIARVGGARERAVLVGDSETDRAAAHNAAVACVLVTFGPEGMGVADLAPEGLLGHFDELPGLLERMVAAV